MYNSEPYICVDLYPEPRSRPLRQARWLPQQGNTVIWTKLWKGEIQVHVTLSTDSTARVRLANELLIIYDSEFMATNILLCTQWSEVWSLYGAERVHMTARFTSFKEFHHSIGHLFIQKPERIYQDGYLRPAPKAKRHRPTPNSETRNFRKHLLWFLWHIYTTKSGRRRCNSRCKV
jgi:hypothetical protein